MNNSRPDLIRSLTPLISAGVGCIIAIATILASKRLTEAQWLGGMGLAGNAIAAAADIAQSSGSKPGNLVQKGLVNEVKED